MSQVIETVKSRSGDNTDDPRERLSVLTPDCVGPIALSCLLAAQGPNPEVRRQCSHAVERFQSLVAAFPPASAEGIFLGRLERVAYAAAATIIEADQEAKTGIERAQTDYENALLGSSVKTQVYLGVVKWIFRVIMLMGASFFAAKLGVDWFLDDMTADQRSRTQWLPFVLAFGVPVFIGVGQSVWRVANATNLVYKRDLRIQAARRRRRAKQKAAIRYAKEQARLAWDDYVGPGIAPPQANPTLDLLQVLHMEELRIKIMPPLTVLIAQALARRWRRFRLRLGRRANAAKRHNGKT